MKIAIISCYFTNNYGSILQAFATENYFKNKGIECNTIATEGIRPFLLKEKKKYYLKNLYRISLLSSKYPQAKLAILRKILPSEKVSFRSRLKRMNNFRKKFSFVGKEATSLKELSEIVKDYDIAVLGGDQLWRPDNILPGYYTLEWVPDNVKKVSFATSFGVSHLDNKSKEIAKRFLKRFSAISVRENTACDMIKEITGQDAIQVCDPVFLISADEWGKIAESSYSPTGGYIFSYFLGNKKWHRKYVEKISQKTGLPVLGISCLDSYLPMDKKVDIDFPDASPEQFLGLIKNARYVCTDSFHVTAFAAMFHRDFSVFKRHSGKKHATNGRLESFLRTLSLEERCVENIDDICCDAIDYSEIDGKINNLTQKSKEFIENFLK